MAISESFCCLRWWRSSERKLLCSPCNSRPTSSIIVNKLFWELMSILHSSSESVFLSDVLKLDLQIVYRKMMCLWKDFPHWTFKSYCSFHTLSMKEKKNKLDVWSSSVLDEVLLGLQNSLLLCFALLKDYSHEAWMTNICVVKGLLSRNLFSGFASNIFSSYHFTKAAFLGNDLW